MNEIEATKKLFRAIKKAVNVLLSREGEKLQLGHGICLEVAGVLGLTRGNVISMFSTGGYAVIDAISLVLEKMGLYADKELIAPAGEWCEIREQLCREILISLDDENFVDEFLESEYYCEVNLGLFDKEYTESLQ